MKFKHGLIITRVKTYFPTRVIPRVCCREVSQMKVPESRRLNKLTNDNNENLISNRVIPRPVSQMKA